ncbi:hypothetical protein [Paenibacillus ginsengarvi]|uniref:Uncharacterized protein n=1 Tax=Paenibacillus ginsengarvi TaxID=400777 RepID=A0A3B0CKH6_9BACL|nr:hypothetical protein [Paenibacillus ginsengarvi]RKN84759.1 hypothetical protein D7M11_12275 [Paenibacillus ginsengarvi]
MNNSHTASSSTSGEVHIPDVSGQTDYVRLLREHSIDTETLYARVGGDRLIEVLLPIDGARTAHYVFGKDQHDDFILFRDGAVSEWSRTIGPDGAESVTANKKFDVLKPWSNKEYALSVSPAGSGFKAQWLPEHNRTGTVFAVSQQLYIDDAEKAEWSEEQAFKPVRTVRIEQRMLGIHPDEPTAPVAEIDCTHLVDHNGVHVRSVVRWLRPVTIGAGYGVMVPVDGAFAGELYTGLGHRYDATATDGSRTNLRDNDEAVSYAFVSRPEKTGEAADFAAAMTVRNIAATFRYDQPGRRTEESVVWLQHRNAGIQKLYPHVFAHHTAEAGDVYEASGTYYVGMWPAGARTLTE